MLTAAFIHQLFSHTQHIPHAMLPSILFGFSLVRRGNVLFETCALKVFFRTWRIGMCEGNLRHRWYVFLLHFDQWIWIRWWCCTSYSFSLMDNEIFSSGSCLIEFKKCETKSNGFFRSKSYFSRTDSGFVIYTFSIIFASFAASSLSLFSYCKLSNRFIIKY